MARKYKFSFPLPGRKSNVEKQHVAKPYQIDTRNADDSPMFDPGDKARRLLGTSEPGSAEPKQKESWRSRQLKKHPSFMSGGTTPAADFVLAKGYEETIVPEKMAPHETNQNPRHTLRNQPSSPLLGKHFMDGYFTWGSVTEVSNPMADRSESSSTLRSYYDPSKSPLAISQQTSASSARDMALRKGCKPIASSPKQGFPDATPFSAVSHEDRRHNDMDSTNRSPQLDFSSLFPKPSTSKAATPSPRIIVKSPSQMSLASNGQRWASSDLSTLPGQTQINAEDYNTEGDGVDSKDMLHTDEHNVKINVKKPSKGSKNWFDGLEEEDNALGVFTGKSMIHTPPEDPRESVKAGLDEVSKDLRLRQRKSSISDPRRRPSTSRRTLSFRLDPVVAQAPSTDPRDSLQSSGLRSTASSVGRSSKRSAQANRISLSSMDLINQSVLVLSSSSDDEVEQSTPRRRARIRDSIEVFSIGDEPLVYNAETVKASKPRPIVRVLSGRASNSTRQAGVPPVPKVPETPQLHQRASSKRWGAEIKSKISSMKVVDDTDIKTKLASMRIIDDPSSSTGDSFASRSSTKIHRSAMHTSNYARGSKMMAVTEEEEKLLEAMRKKRASIRKIDFAEGFQKALQLHGDIEPANRPKTSSADGRPTFFDPDRTSSIPPLPHGLRNSLTGAPFAASTDNLVHVDSNRVPETTQRWTTNVSSIPTPVPSPSLSFSPSDLLSSPPSSCLSPRTPPLDHEFSEAYAGGIGASPSRQLQLWDPSRHNRKQSASSGVFTLSPADRRARDIESEDRITGWAIDRW